MKFISLLLCLLLTVPLGTSGHLFDQEIVDSSNDNIGKDFTTSRSSGHSQLVHPEPEDMMEYNEFDPGQIETLQILPPEMVTNEDNVPIEESNQPLYPSPKIKVDSMHVSHAPIFINGDTDFATTATNEGWSGDGSMGNPYVISGYNISGVSGIPIQIVNTAVYFVIEDNILRDSIGTGLFLQNVDNAVVSQNMIYNTTHNALYLRNVSNNNITSNVVMNSTYNGIYLLDSSQHTILHNNTVWNSDAHGIFVNGVANNISIVSNTLYDGRLRGIYIYNSDGLFVEDNNASLNRHDGIYLNRSDDSIVTNNDVHENQKHGIYLVNCNNLTVSENAASINDDGIQTRIVTNSTFVDNTVFQNRLSGIAILTDSVMNDILGNIAFNNSGNGLYMSGMDNSTVIGNHLFENGDTGMQLIRSSSVIVTYNNINDNDGYGMKLTYSGGNDIKHNIFTHDGYYVQGNELENYKQTTFTNNTADGRPILYIKNTLGPLPTNYAQLIIINISDETISGLSVTDRETPLIVAFGERLTISNNEFSHNFANGMAIANVNDSVIEDNQFHHNGLAGLIMDWEGYNNVIDNNEFYNNTERGLYLIDNDDALVSNNIAYNNTGTNFAIARVHGSVIEDNVGHSSVHARGIALDRSENNTIVNNELYSNNEGIYVFRNSHNTSISGNSAYENRYTGIYIRDSDNSTLEYNTVHGNNHYGYLSVNTPYLEVIGNEAYENGYYGIYVYATSDVLIIDNQTNNNTYNGIALRKTSNSTIEDNVSFENGWDGIALYESSTNNTVHNNWLYSNVFKGIFLDYSGYNNVTFNRIEHNDQHGLILNRAQQNRIINNTFVDDGMYVQSNDLDRLYQIEVANNTVNGKPLIYIQNKHDGTVVTGAGQVIIIDSSYVVVDGNEFANLTTGALVRYSTHVSIRNNLFANSSGYAVILVQMTNMTSVIGNNFVNNRINSTSQAYDDGYDNQFAYNFWDTGSDVDVDGDGISEVPYMIFGTANNLDHSPLIRPYSILSNSITQPTIISPNGGEIVNGTITVEWSEVDSLASQTIRYDLYYSEDGGISFTTIAQGIIGTSTYDWDTRFVDNGDEFLVKVVAINMNNGLAAEDLSDDVFSVENSGREGGSFFDDIPQEYLFGGAGILVAILALLGGGVALRRRLRG